MPNPVLRLAFVPTLLLIGSCDNVGRVWDPDITEPPDPEPAASIVQIVPVGGDVRDGRPKVRAAYPKDSGWPSTVPIVVEFSESINVPSIVPSTTGGIDGRVVLRVQGTTQVLPCQYDVLANGRLLVLRPITALSNEQNPTYEVVLLPEARDVDGVRFDTPAGGSVLAEFQVNQAEEFTDGRILAVWPRDNARDIGRENDYFIVFDRPANAATLEPNITLSPDGGTALAGDVETPLQTVGQPDPRLVRFEPDLPLAASTTYELVVTEDITFGSEGQLDFNNRTPFARFETGAPAAPSAVELANPVPGFPDKINIDNQASVMVRATPPADAVAGDTLRVRIYGLDATTTTAADLVFIERTVELTQGGANAVTVDFTGALGTLTSPQFEDGAITFAVQMQRGSQTSGFIHNPASAGLRFDITRPTLVRAGPPGSLDNRDLFSDTEFVAFHGVASEGLAEARLADGVNPVEATMFASDGTGRFVVNPLPIGPRLTAPRPYFLTLRDRAGNISAGQETGNIVQRGLVTGAFAGTLTVEAYDESTLQPIAGATVLLDPGTPVVPAVAQLVQTTGVDGRAEFAGLGAGPWTVTIARAGYDLVTLYRTGAAYASLPLRPLTNATATLQGTMQFVPTPGTTVVVGNTAFASHSPLGVQTATATPTVVPDTPIVPNRMQVVTAFASIFEPTAAPTFSSHGYQMLGVNFTTLTLPGAPAAPGTVSRQDVTLLPSTGGITQLANPFPVDFALATGLDTANLVGGRPVTRVTGSLNAFDGQALFGVGFVVLSTGAVYTIDANFGLPASGYAVFGPVFWVVSEARDTTGNSSRHRGFLDLATGGVLVGPGPLPIPAVSSAGGTGSPLVTVVDVLDETTVPAGKAALDLTATDTDGRRWVVLATDGDALGTPEAIQLPDLGTAGVVGLRTGAWNLRAEARLWLAATGATADDWTLTERTRMEVLYARSAATAITVQ